MATLLTLESDMHFVQSNFNGTGVSVYEYNEYKNIFGMIHASCPRWTRLAEVPGASPGFSGLKVFGVTFLAEGLDTLARDLTITGENGEKLHLVVNRQGVCFVNAGQNDPIQWLRISGLFCWSKYGVVKPDHQVREASNVAVLDGALAIMPANCSLEDVKSESEEIRMEQEMKIEQMEKELASLKATLKGLRNG